MGNYTCECCDFRRNTDNDGFRTIRYAGGGEFVACAGCYRVEMLSVLNGTFELEAVDGEALGDDFLCPECLEVRPEADAVEFQFNCEGGASSAEGIVCTCCRDARFTSLNRDGYQVIVYNGESWAE